MAEDTVEQERQPVISDLFPIGEQSVSAAFKELSLRENPSSFGEAVNEETRIVGKTNGCVSNYFSDFAQEMKERKASEEVIDQFSLGAIIGHRVLREEAKSKGGVLPTFTEEFVEGYHNKDVERLKVMKIDDQLTVEQAAIQVGNIEIIRFENWEPKFSKILREKLGLQSGWRREDDPVYLGIVEQYLLFRAGCKDRKNFVQ